jgi:hypothetical protein
MWYSEEKIEVISAELHLLHIDARTSEVFNTRTEYSSRREYYGTGLNPSQIIYTSTIVPDNHRYYTSESISYSALVKYRDADSHIQDLYLTTRNKQRAEELVNLLKDKKFITWKRWLGYFEIPEIGYSSTEYDGPLIFVWAIFATLTIAGALYMSCR